MSERFLSFLSFLSVVIKALFDSFNRLGGTIVTFWPVLFRASLYFFGSFFLSLGDKLGPIFFQDVWPSKPYTCGALLVATGAGLIVLRAYYDSSPQRHSEALQGKSTGPTEFFVKKP